jgi:hypothetical protein
MSPAFTLGASCALIVIGYVAERRIPETEPLVSVPDWVAALVGGLGLSLPFVVFVWEDLLTVSFVDDLVAALAASLVLWLVSVRLLGIGQTTSC